MGQLDWIVDVEGRLRAVAIQQIKSHAVSKPRPTGIMTELGLSNADSLAGDSMVEESCLRLLHYNMPAEQWVRLSARRAGQLPRRAREPAVRMGARLAGATAALVRNQVFVHQSTPGPPWFGH